MLNKTQREFRKKMKEVERGKKKQQDVYSYRDQRFGNDRKRRSIKRSLLQIGGVASLLVLLWNLYAFSSYIIPGDENRSPLSAKQQEVHQFVQKSSDIELTVSESVNSLIERFNDNSLTPFHIEEAQKELFELQKRVETEDIRFLAMKSTMDEHFNLAYQVTNVLKLDASSSVHEELVYIIDKTNEVHTRQKQELMHLLDNENIGYELLGDGSISYDYEL